MTDPLRSLLDRADRDTPGFTADELTGWPGGAVDRFATHGLLAEAAPAAAVTCDACGDGHVEPVVWVDVPGRPPRAFLSCPDVGRVPVPVDRLRRWAVSFARLAGLVGEAVVAGGPVEAVVPGRVWRLGRLTAGGRRWVGFLAVQLHGPDGPAVVDRVPDLGQCQAVVFVPVTVPPAAVWGTHNPPAVVRLADLLTISETGLAADRQLLDAAVPPAGGTPRPPIAPTPLPAGTSWADVELRVGDHEVVVRAGGTVRPIGFAEAGFENRQRGGVPNAAWELLKRFARQGGVITTGDRVATKSASLKALVSQLRQRLKAVVGVDSDPFHPVRKGQPYRARFRIRPADGPVVTVEPGTAWEQITVVEDEGGWIRVGVDGTRTTAGYDPGNTDGALEAVRVDARREYRYLLEETGWKPETRAAFLAVLRAGGRVQRPPGDPGLLAVGAALSRFIPARGQPFGYDPRTRVWVSHFTAESLASPSDR